MKRTLRDSDGLCYRTVQLPGMSSHLNIVTYKELLAENKERRVATNKNRNKKNDFPMFVDGTFNCEPAPWGFNYYLGYCEQSNNFDNN